MSPDLERARAERRAAEERLEQTREHLIIPLREIRRENHIGPLLDSLIRRRAGKQGDT